MKKVLLFMLLLVSITMTAQKDVTKFLGIPIDGNKTEMRKKLIAKGFSYNSQYDFLEGEFNGSDVRVYIVTNNNKVWRIQVSEAKTYSESEIKIRFNNLCRQFAKNTKYVAANLGERDYSLSEEEDISYEMLVHKKRYDAYFYQKPDTSLINTTSVQSRIQKRLLQDFTQEEIDNPTDTQQKEIDQITYDEVSNIFFDTLKKKLVWFMICEFHNQYYITIFYDNEYNHADGEDL